MTYPYRHYWLADDGRVFDSARQIITTDTDPEYLAALAAHYVPSPWPRDLAGVQTEAELQTVLEPFNLFVNLSYYTVNKRWLKEQAGITLASGMPIKTNDRAQAKISGAYLAAQLSATVTTQWHAADDTVHELTAAQIEAMNVELLTHINNCFSISADVLAGIDAGTITARDQVDAAFDAPMTQARKDWLKH